MPLINKAFNGKMNLDVQPYRLPEGDYKDALNITRDAQGRGEDLVVSNIPGNTFIPYNLPDGVNKLIGNFPDKVRNRVYTFVWNSLGYHSILYLNRNTNVINKLIENLTDSDNVDILKFDPSYKINHIDIIYRDLEGDLLSFTDGHSTPKEFNVEFIEDGVYGVLQDNFIEAAKRPPLPPPTCVYGSDININSNSLRKKLFMFSHAWKYDNFAQCTFSTYSKIPLPIGYYGSDNDIDSTSNNFITITVETGDKNVTDIIIAMHYSIGNSWSDFVRIATLNKEQLGIPNNSIYQFLFYNDQIYPSLTQGVQYVDGVQVVPLFDWLPQLAYTQCLGNGNIYVYGNITEGYDNYPVSELDVTITAENITNVPPDTDPPSITYLQNSVQYTFTVNGNVFEGTVFTISAFQMTPPLSFVLATYTSVAGDTVDDVATGMFNYVSANNPSWAQLVMGNVFILNNIAGSSITTINVVPGTIAGISTEKTWLWDSNYIFGQVYVDEQNRDMPGVTTYTDPNNSDNDYSVTTPSFSLDLGSMAVQTPVITAQVNHLPYPGSDSFNWVRRRQTYSSILFYMTCDFQDDPDGDGYLFFCLENIEAYKEANSQFIYGTAPITSDSRIKVVAGITADAYNGDIWTQDYEILGTVIKTLTGGSSPDDDKTFIKVKKPAAGISPPYTANMLVMVYTPSVNPTSDAESVYYEWGETYDIYTGWTIVFSSPSATFTDGETIVGGTSGATATIIATDALNMAIDGLVGVFQVGETITGGTSLTTATLDSISDATSYHRGMTQDQTSFQPAIYVWIEGDVYFHDRTMYSELLSLPYATSTVPLMDANWSDFFDSAVNDNGRAQVIEVNAKRQNNPVLQRFGGAYQNGTNVNNMNTFYFEDFDEYDRSNGAIKRTFIEGRKEYVMQEFDIGIVPVLTQIVKDTAGNPLEANSDLLLNKITYPYSGKYGIGNIPSSFAYGKGRKYIIDNNKGVVNRIGIDGSMTPLSITYECNAFFVSTLEAYNSSLNNGFAATGEVYTGDPTVYCAFNEYTNILIIALEEINRYDVDGNLIFHQDGLTLTFREADREQTGFESFVSFKPEMIGCLNNMLYSGLNGGFWKHEDAPYCNFYDVQYGCYIVPVFNKNQLEKKTWTTLTVEGNTIWPCTEIFTQLLNQSGQPQQSNLIEQDFATLENNYSATFKRDTGFGSTKYNGNTLKGNYMIIKFEKAQAPNFVFLNVVSVKYITSYLTTH